MLRDIIGGLLLVSAGIAFISSVMWVILGDERWWLRFAFAMILLGLWYAGSKEEKEDN